MRYTLSPHSNIVWSPEESHKKIYFEFLIYLEAVVFYFFNFFFLKHKKHVHLEEVESESDHSATCMVCFPEVLTFISLLFKHFTAGERFLIALLRSIAQTASDTTFAILNME